MSKPKFERRHYKAVAEAMRVALINSVPGYQLIEARPVAWNNMKHELGGMFADDNPRFDRGKFEEACEP